MKVLVVGGGGREHAIVWKLAQSNKVEKIYCAPGNAGIASMAECIDISPNDFDSLLDFVKYNWIDLTIVGPEDPLSNGIVDAFEKEKRHIMGPGKAAAQLEGSKAFAKDFMKRYGIPTAEYKTFTSYTQAEDYIKLKGTPIVVKADGLAAGKGVIVCQDFEQAQRALDSIMKDKDFGDAGDRVVVEECLIGEEASYMAFCDGTTILPMVSSQDHKQVHNGDKGPNTGGMGAYSPAPVVTDELEQEIMETIMRPVLDGFKNEGVKFKGILYAGVMVTDKGPKVLEYNCRLGDPETQPIMMRLETDLVDISMAVSTETLSDLELTWKQEAACCVVLASEGYPAAYPKGRPITGIEEANALGDDVYVFQAGTAFKNDELVTAGGRVLGVTGLGATIKEAKERAHEAIEKISFEGMHFRSDIGDKALRRLAK
jgi:phosphoribosylamine--glycine ligase